MQSSDYDVESLNDLIATMTDSDDQGMAAEVGRLQDYVVELGGTPAAAGTVAATALAPGFVPGREHVAAKVERALSDADLAPRTRALIGEVFGELKEPDEDQADEMKLAA